MSTKTKNKKKVKPMELRPYQREARDAVIENWNDPEKGDNQLICLPTAAGKTIIFANIIDSIFKQYREEGKEARVLILAHLLGLVDQAADKLQMACNIDSFREQGPNYAIKQEQLPNVVVSSIQTFSRPGRLEQYPQDCFTHIVVDEAHHCLSPSYQRLLNYFTGAKVLGVTATPNRNDKKNLADFFNDMAYQYTIAEAVRDKYLTPICVKMIPLELDISHVQMQNGDYASHDVGVAIEPYLDAIAKEMVKYCKHHKTVVFLPLVSTAKKMVRFLKKHGLKAKCIHGKLPPETRAKILEEFECGDLEVLCNAMLLTEGWDCPPVDRIVNLRATKSQTLLIQIIGRGLRLYKKKKELLVLDFLWHTAKMDLCTPAVLVASSDEEKEYINEKLRKSAESGEEIDILGTADEFKKSVEESAMEKLSQSLEDAKMYGSTVVTFDPLRLAVLLHDSSLASYEPIFAWEKRPPSKAQLDALKPFGLDAMSVTCCGHASKILSVLFERRHNHMATLDQLSKLRDSGYKGDVDTLTKGEAARILGEDLEKATDKQIYFLKMRGVDASSFSKEDAFVMISKIKREEETKKEGTMIAPPAAPSTPAPPPQPDTKRTNIPPCPDDPALREKWTQLVIATYFPNNEPIQQRKPQQPAVKPQSESRPHYYNNPQIMATDKQIYFLKKRGIDGSHMTKREASNRISTIIEMEKNAK